jgi:hypothetical protein
MLSLSCLNEEKATPNMGIATFTLHEKDRINPRPRETSAPAFVLMNIQTSNGKRLEEIKLDILSPGSIVLFENPGQPVGRYHLTEFVVYDASNKPIYAAPKSGSELAEFVTNSLPIEFDISNNNNTPVAVDLLPVFPNENPEFFGYRNLSFEIIGPAGKVRKVVFRDLFIDDAVTTMHFEYDNEKVGTVRWTFDYNPAGVKEHYTERRFYSSNGDLDSLAGGKFNGSAWNVSYEYVAGRLNTMKSYRNDSITTVNFLKYEGTKPILIENLYGFYGIYEGAKYPRFTTFEFDETGNLVSQENTGIPGHPNVTQEKITTYNSELNPLRNLIETPMPQAIEHFDDLVFYFSTHLPTTVESNYPYVYPENNRITFEYSKDDDGRIIQIKALRPDHNSLRYTLDITYY